MWHLWEVNIDGFFRRVAKYGFKHKNCPFEGLCSGISLLPSYESLPSFSTHPILQGNLCANNSLLDVGHYGFSYWNFDMGNSTMLLCYLTMLVIGGFSYLTFDMDNLISVCFACAFMNLFGHKKWVCLHM
jgi:hypothetical protein